MKQPLIITGPMYPPTLAELEQTYDAHRLWTAPDKDALIASAPHWPSFFPVRCSPRS